MTKGVQIEVESCYQPERSSPEKAYYFFSYTVRLRNLGSETVQLLNRHWVITNADGEVQEVRGLGVVGEQPSLRPGESFEYTSFCPLNTPVGSMHGHYGMVAATGEVFEARINPFTLAVPTAVN